MGLLVSRQRPLKRYPDLGDEWRPHTQGLTPRVCSGGPVRSVRVSDLPRDITWDSEFSGGVTHWFGPHGPLENTTLGPVVSLEDFGCPLFPLCLLRLTPC